MARIEDYYAPEVEKALLGAMILDNSIINTVMSKLTENHFMPGLNRNLFNAINENYLNGKSIDEFIAGLNIPVNFIAECTGNPAGLVEYHIQILINKGIYRAIRQLFKKAQTDIENNVEAVELIAGLQSELSNIRKYHTIRDEIIDTRAGINAFLERLELLQEELTDHKVIGIKSGFPSLDNIIMDFEPGEFILLAAATSIGKTTMCVNMTRNMAQNGKCVGVFVLESTALKLWTRIMSQECVISRYYLHENLSFVSEKIGQILNNYNIYMDECSGIGIDRLRDRIINMKALKDINIAFVDYIGMVQGKGKNPYERTSSISSILKALAQEIKIPIVGICQLSREVSRRENKHPQLSDLRDSGNLEQDADKIIFLYRENYYQHSPVDSQNEKLEIRVAKNRDGRTGNIELNIRLDCGLIEERREF